MRDPYSLTEKDYYLKIIIEEAFIVPGFDKESIEIEYTVFDDSKEGGKIRHTIRMAVYRLKNILSLPRV